MGHFGFAAVTFLTILPFVQVSVFLVVGFTVFEGVGVGAGCPFEIVTLTGSEANRPDTTRKVEGPFTASELTVNVVVDSKFGVTAYVPICTVG